MFLSKLVKFRANTAQTFIFNIDDPQVHEAILSFQAYGYSPMQAMFFAFRGPQGELLFEYQPMQALASGNGLMVWMRKQFWMLKFDYCIHRMIHRLNYYTVDVPISCFVYKQVTVEIRNKGNFPLFFGRLSLKR
jgi:hypothetical protein